MLVTWSLTLLKRFEQGKILRLGNHTADVTPTPLMPLWVSLSFIFDWR